MNQIPRENVLAASEGLKAIAHEIRLTVLCHLLQGPMTVSELLKATGTEQTNLSKHLSKMRLLGLVETEKQGNFVQYRIANPHWGEVINALKTIYCPD
ncbi:MAG: metalloregulator ArsR/SmtB family transcription factor [Gammaproteobacteria bacterium]|nr:metalloregulator ArsR/SmtB family transcription factor [Gammaproteobacteria bacterium]